MNLCALIVGSSCFVVYSRVINDTQNDWGGYGGYFTDLDGYYWEVAYGQDWEFDVIEEQ